MNKDDRIINNTLTDNDDIRELITVVNSDFNRYQEIHFNESINQIRKKWPLLDEVQQVSAQVHQQVNLTDAVAGGLSA